MIDQDTREAMNEAAIAHASDPSYVECLEAILERNEGTEPENAEYMRGQLEMVADLYAIPGVATADRIEQIMADMKKIDEPEPEGNKPISTTDDSRTAKVQFRPYVTIEVGGTIGSPSIVSIGIDWEESCEGTVIPQYGVRDLTMDPAETFACEWCEDNLDPTIEKAVEELLRAD